MRTFLQVSATAVALSAAALAQCNPPPATPNNAPSQFVNGLDIAGYVTGGWTDGGNTGGMSYYSMQTTACNFGTVLGTWLPAPNENHPTIGQMYCRLHNGRFEQISNWSHLKHSFGSTNSNGCGGGCQGGATFNQLGINCSDTYSASRNASRSYLGPACEVNPFTGEWEMTGSYIDRGDPDVGFPQNQDGNPSPLNPSGVLTNRCVIPHSKIGTPGATYFAMVHYTHRWEGPGSDPGSNGQDNKWNNNNSRQVTISPTFVNDTSSHVYGSVLATRYTGARVESGANYDGAGNPRDGRFFVGSVVTNNGDGTWHYEYAIHNRDNHGRNAEFRIPICAGATHSGAGMKAVNVNGDYSNWSITRQGDEIVFSSPNQDSAQPWNTIANFWFDADAAPDDGDVTIVQGIINPSANGSITIAQDVPAIQAAINLGGGCGIASPPVLNANGVGTLPNPTFSLTVNNVSNGAPVALHLNFNGNSFPFAGCTVLNPEAAIPGTVSGGSSTWAFPLPNDPTAAGFSITFQAAEAQVGGSVLGLADLSNILEVPLCYN